MNIDVLVMTALKDELNALCAVEPVATWTDEKDPSGYPFHHRQFGNLRIAAAWVGAMGETASATRTAALVSHLNPTCLAMCGICAGNRKDVSLGDVIVADRMYSYDHGKIVTTKNSRGRNEEHFFHDITTYNLDPRWRIQAGYFAEDASLRERIGRLRPPSLAFQDAWLRHRLAEYDSGKGPSPEAHPERRANCPNWTRSLQSLIKGGYIKRVNKGKSLSLTRKGEQLVNEERVDHIDGLPADPPLRIHVGTIATGKTVRKDSEIFGRLERLIRKTIGIEMEAASIGHVAEHFHRKAIVIKAVSDYGDDTKDDSFRTFAAQASAEVLIQFITRALDSSLFTENPYYTAGTIPLGHPTYIDRSCDLALESALRSQPLISVEGNFSTGKSSLLVKACDALGATHRTCLIDFQDLRLDDEHVFMRELFDAISRKLGPIDSWSALDDPQKPPVALLFDEFGLLTRRSAQSLIPQLVHFATKRGAGVRVIASLPVTAGDSIQAFLARIGVEREKYLAPWHRVLIPLFTPTEIDRLTDLLPGKTRELAHAKRTTIADLSNGLPIAVQRGCSALFDAHSKGASDSDIDHLIASRKTYER